MADEETPYPENAIEYEDVEDDRDDSSGSHCERNWLMYKQSTRNAPKRYGSDFDLNTIYPLANSHGNAYRESSSHSKYTDRLQSEFCAKNNLDATRRDLVEATLYPAANSHGDHDRGAAVGNTLDPRDYRRSSESDILAWDAGTYTNYEIANSHSNYRVFYDSQTQHRGIPAWYSSEFWSPENRRVNSRVVETSNDSEDNNAKKRDGEERKTSADQSTGKIGNDSQDSQATKTCDIQQCLVQIEESLLSIEQNLLQVQDLDIPELRNLLYKSPSIEQRLCEVQDILYDGIAPSKKSMSFDSNEEKEEDEGEEEGEEEKEEEEEEGGEKVWIGQGLTVKNNDDEDTSAPLLLNGSNEELSDTLNIDERDLSKLADDDRRRVDRTDESSPVREDERNSSFMICAESPMNFVPNSLGKTPPRRIVLDEAKENIRLCSSEPEESAIAIDYNLNSTCAEKKSFLRDKWRSGTNSLDENSIFQELGGKEENGFPASADNRLTVNAKARSESALPTDRDDLSRRGRGRSHEDLLQAVEATAEDFRKKLESLESQCDRRLALDRQRRTTPNLVRELADSAMPRSKHAIATPKGQDKESGIGKSSSDCDKRKRKKGKGQSASEGALVPSKLISLSLSLLLAALLQAIRCLTDLVEDAFRSISYDRGGLLQ